MSTLAERDTQATVVGLLLPTLGDGGRGQVMSIVNRRRSSVQRGGHLIVTQRRADPSA